MAPEVSQVVEDTISLEGMIRRLKEQIKAEQDARMEALVSSRARYAANDGGGNGGTCLTFVAPWPFLGTGCSAAGFVEAK